MDKRLSRRVEKIERKLQLEEKEANERKAKLLELQKQGEGDSLKTLLLQLELKQGRKLSLTDVAALAGIGKSEQTVDETERNRTLFWGKVVSEKAKLTTKQAKAIPILLAARSYEEGCKKARVAKSTFYAWMQDEGFAAEFDRQRNEIVEAAFGLIAQNIEKAVSTLVGLLDSKDERVKRLTANDVIGHFLRQNKLKDLEERIERIEERLEARG